MKLHRIASLAAPLAASALLAVATGCGAGEVSDTGSEVQWTPIAGTNKATLEARDFTDEFVFGLRVVSAKGVNNAALMLDMRPTAVKLMEFQPTETPDLGKDPFRLNSLVPTQNGGPELRLVPVGGSAGQSLASFAYRKSPRGSRLLGEIDFGSSSLMRLEGTRLGSGLANVLEEQENIGWVSHPERENRVLRVEQTSDLLLADVEQSLQKVAFSADMRSFRVLGEGSVVLRIYLKRRSVARFESPSVGDARALSIGYFAGRSTPTLAEEAGLKIARHPLDVRARETRTVYLKDFPSDMVATATNGVKAWNVAFGYEAFKVRIAPASVDIGDPRYSVVKWYDGLSNETPWAGYAPTMADPVTGEMFSAQILINGSTVRSEVEKLAAYTNRAVPEFESLKGSFGNVPLVPAAGESPVVSLFTNPSEKDPKKYVQGYYYGVIMHEVGHALGLRHNFAASTKLDPDGTPSSVMDYEPKLIADKRKGIGSYDVAAIRFGYFGERPTEKLTFCTDENLRYSYSCNQGDLGDPAAYVAASVINTVGFVKKSALPLPALADQRMKGSIKNLYSLGAKARWSAKCEGAAGGLAASVEAMLSEARIKLEGAFSTTGLSALVRSNLNVLNMGYREGRDEGEKMFEPPSCTIDREFAYANLRGE